MSMTDYSERVEFHLIVSHDDDMLPSCEYNFACRSRSAKNVANLRPCPCGKGPKFRLCCNECKELLLLTQDSVECASCGSITQPARAAYRSFEDISSRRRS